MLSRKQFLYSLAGLAALGCGGGEPRPDPTPDGDPSTGGPEFPDASTDAPASSNPDAATATCASTTSTISANHGHTAIVPAADVNAGIEKSYDITGTSDHPHTVTVTATMFATLRDGGMVSVTSTFDGGHTHGITLKCG